MVLKHGNYHFVLIHHQQSEMRICSEPNFVCFCHFGELSAPAIWRVVYSYFQKSCPFMPFEKLFGHANRMKTCLLWFEDLCLFLEPIV